jgi:hypothetical protein
VGLSHLLTRGVREALLEGRPELDAFLRQAGAPEGTGEHIAQTLEAMPGLIVALDRALSKPEVPPFASALFDVVVRYLIRDDDLIPTHGGESILGLLDDVFLLHRAAQELRAHLDGVEMRSVDGGVHLLEGVLPAEVVRQLDRQVARAVEEAQVRISLFP